jgi:hypothetical protein
MIKKSTIGQLDKEILNSLDFGFGLYEEKTCVRPKHPND